MNVTLAHPLALLFLLLVPVHLLITRSGRRSLPLPRAHDLRVSPVTRALAALPGALRILALVALVLAIAGPSTAVAVVDERRDGIPIILAIDISSSMLAQDFRPRDRIEVAKATISRFIEGREADPIGLVAFAGEAITLVPATTHRGVLLAALSSLQVGLLEDGTAIGDGLAIAVNRLRAFERGSGVIVLLSDGENNRGSIDPRAAADAATSHGVQVFAVGVGSEGLAPVPVDTTPAGFRYAELPVGLDEAMLREIAERTSGAYFRATDPQALERIYAEIDRMVPSIVETTQRVETVDWAATLLLLAATLTIGEWAMRGSRWGALP
jgi:Ca-activated chloride channel homolog